MWRLVVGFLSLWGVTGEEAALQVDVVGLEFLQTHLESVGDVSDVGNDFCGYEELLPGLPGFLYRHAEFSFGLVDFGTIEMCVA